jgi:hypothetical protein
VGCEREVERALLDAAAPSRAGLAHTRRFIEQVEELVDDPLDINANYPI